MIQNIEAAGLHCLCAFAEIKSKVAYILYPMDILSGWIEDAVKRYGTAIVVITGMDWQNVFSPWPAKGVPPGCPDFKGESAQFLKTLQTEVIPAVEKRMGFSGTPERTLVGVSMSGLFTLWQWMECDLFDNVASLSGSFWYEGFADWFCSRRINRKQGMAFFLLGKQESRSSVKAFDSVAADTQKIVTCLEKAGIRTEYVIVPGNHYSDPIPRLDKAFTCVFAESTPNGKTGGNS